MRCVTCSGHVGRVIQCGGRAEQPPLRNRRKLTAETNEGHAIISHVISHVPVGWVCLFKASGTERVDMGQVTKHSVPMNMSRGVLGPSCPLPTCTTSLAESPETCVSKYRAVGTGGGRGGTGPPTFWTQRCHFDLHHFHYEQALNARKWHLRA